AVDMPTQARGGSGANLLDNAYWAIPECIINQRGVSGTIAAKGYFIDRWKLADGSVTITDDGLLLNGTMVQILETDPGQEVTASYLTDDGVFPAEYDSETRTFAITADGALLRAAKLEVGSVQTLAHQDEDGNWVLNDPPPDKAVELLKCQRYYYRPGRSYYTSGYVTSSARQYYMPIELPAPMRTTPTVSMDSYVARTASGYSKRTGSSPAIPNNLYTSSYDANRCQVLLVDAIESAVDTNNTTMAYQINWLTLDADL
ncbi:MAG: hypothetical protein K2K53_01290, partial [Oscillospiraceae bacterium]|nr:hypothetical protein [Oscillospiraceae bacterium]